MLIAKTAIAAPGEENAVARFGEIGDQGVVVRLEDLGAHGHAQNDIATLGTGAAAAHAVSALLRLEMLLVAIVDEGVQPFDGFCPDIAALAAVTPIGTSELYEFFAAKADAARTPIARAEIDLCLIEELHGEWLGPRGQRCARGVQARSGIKAG